MSFQAPNLGSIANDLQSISRSFAGLCIELSKLENLPSVDLLTQLKSLNDSIAVKKEMTKLAEDVKAAEEKMDKRLDELFAEMKAVKSSVEALQKRVTTVENIQIAQKMEECNSYARRKNSLKSSGHYTALEDYSGVRE
ncbi:hypothetical protein BDZ91DRAFT_735827 [Kalaharituber pfeilii]|nr:hypothetical protein BDZ91DRAFT_735827 [Kalaharituber pfeilii]